MARDAGTEAAHSGGPRIDRNVNGLERALSLAAGGGLAAYALKRKDWTGLGLGVLAGVLLERGVTGRCAVYHALGVTTADGGLERQHGRAATVDAQKARKVEHAVTIPGAARERLFAFWRRLENLPRIFDHLERVESLDAGGLRTRWTATAPAGQRVTWDAEIVNEVPGSLIGWKSLAGSQIANAGSVHFSDAAGGTELRVVLEYEPPAGAVGVAVARLFGEEPDVQLRESLQRFREFVASGQLDHAADVAAPRVPNVRGARTNTGGGTLDDSALAVE